MNGGRRIGRFGQLLAPGYSWCLRCQTPWKFVKNHVTDYNASNGCFPLCEECWAELTPEQRLPFYRRLIESWYETRGPGFGQEWAQVEAAVLNGA